MVSKSWKEDCIMRCKLRENWSKPFFNNIEFRELKAISRTYERNIIRFVCKRLSFFVKSPIISLTDKSYFTDINRVREKYD